jgi:glycosyltransferase involved in cell wall biosynthesis
VKEAPVRPTAPLRIVTLAPALPFPEGRAATSRARLLSLALVNRGHHVTVVSTRVTEVPPSVNNWARSGEWRGVRFLYTTGTTVRHERFLARRLVEFRGSVVAVIWLCRRKLRREIDCVYLWSTVLQWTAWGAGFRLLLRALRIPFVIELNELPWPLRSQRNAIEKHVSPLSGATGAICISAFLEQWARDRSSGHSRLTEVRRVPIVADLEELPEFTARAEGAPQVLLASSAGFIGELRLVLGAMEVVWDKEPDCRLVITGWSERDADAAQALPVVRAASRPQNVVLAGNLPRPQLLAMYAASSALLAPLVDTFKSQARFPTKIGEYLASGRPVVTTNVGEPGRLLTDGVNAYVAATADFTDYGDAILRAIQAEDAAPAVGQQGRNLAREEFYYLCWGECLESLFATCSKKA